MSDDPAGWHLDKRVPIALILALAAQVAIFGMLYGELKTEVRTNSRTIVSLQVNAIEMQRDAAERSVQLGRIESELLGQRRDLQRLLSIMDRAFSAPGGQP